MNPEISSTDRFVDRIARAEALDPAADAVQALVRKTLDESGIFASLNDVLHGKPLGHSAHVVLTDVPIGAWTMAAIFDTLELFGRREFLAAADVAIVVGLAGGVGAIATGLAEWSDTKDEPKRLGLVHALTNDAAFGLYALSFGLRRGGRRGLALGAAFAGYAILSLGAYLGGELSLGQQIGVRHTAPPIDSPDEFVAVLDENELGDEPKTADLAGIPILLARDASGNISAIAATCTHRGAPLGEGTFEDGCVTCPWHAARFELRTGDVRKGPAVFPLARFETRVVAGKIEARRAHQRAGLRGYLGSTPS